MNFPGDHTRLRRRTRSTLLLAIALTALGALSASGAQAAGTVTTAVTGQGTATGPGIDCNQSGGPDCSESYPNQRICETDPETGQSICYFEPQYVELTAGADSNGFVYDGWLGCDIVTDRTCGLTVTADTTLTARFRDAQAPSVGSLSPSSGVQRGTIGLSASVSDNSGSVNRVEFRVRGVLVATDTSAPYGTSFNTATVTDGAATLRATAFDAGGNSSFVDGSITIDNTAPTLGVSGGPDGQTFGPGSTQTWTFSAGDATSGVASVQCSVVPTGSAASYGACSGGSSSHAVSGLGDGSYTFTVRARDNGGLETIRSRSFTIDGGPPETAITGGPADGSSSTASTVTFSFTSSEGGGTYACRVFPAGLTPPAFDVCSGEGTHTSSGLNPGTYTFQVRATDAVGNLDTSPAARTFTVLPPDSGNAGAGGGGSGAGGTTGGTGTTGTTAAPNAVADAQIASLLGADLAAGARQLGRQRMSLLAKKGLVALSFRSLEAGRFTLTFKGAATRVRAARTTVIAKTARTLPAAGTYKLTLRLTKAGKTLLRHGRRTKGKLTVQFVRSSGARLTHSKSVTLKRR